MSDLLNFDNAFSASGYYDGLSQEVYPAGAVVTGDAVPSVAGTSKPWANKALMGAMPKILGQIGKTPRNTGVAPAASGRSVTASSQGVMNPHNAVQDMANNNPLADINKWSNLF